MVKMLTPSILLPVGVMLVAEGLEEHIERGYIRFAMGFSLVMQLLNLKVHKTSGV